MRINDIIKLYKLLDHKELSVVHCQDIQNKKLINRREILGQELLINWVKEYNGRGNCFIGRAPRNIKKEVLQSNVVTLDIDPIENTPLSDVIAYAYKIDKSCGNTASLAISGKGVLMIWKGQLSGEYTAKFAEDMRSKFPSDKVKIDATHDDARLIKIIGTLSTKLPITQTRFLVYRPNGTLNYSSTTVDKIGQTHETLTITPASVGKPSRSEAIYAQACYFHDKLKLSKEECYNALKINPFGRNDRDDDFRRIVDKLYGNLSSTEKKSPNEEISLDAYRKSLSNTNVNNEFPTPYPKLDKMLNNFQRGRVYVFGAETGAGKTSLILNLIASWWEKYRILYLTTEMQKRDILDRYISIVKCIPADHFQHRTFNEEEKDVINKFLDKFETKQYTISDTFTPDLQHIKDYMLSKQYDIVVVDHIQHVKLGPARRQELALFVQEFHNLVIEQQCVGLMASQLTRPQRILNMQNQKQIIAPPSKYDLKECGEIENEADAVLLLHDKGKKADVGVKEITLIVDKNRHGIKGEIKYEFFETFTRFKEV